MGRRQVRQRAGGMGQARGHQTVGGRRVEVGDFQAGCDLMMGEQHLRVTGHEMGARAGEDETGGRHWRHNLVSPGTVVWHFETCKCESLDSFEYDQEPNFQQVSIAGPAHLSAAIRDPCQT